MISTVFKTTALADEVEWFFEAALKGEIRTNEDGPAPFCIGSQKTPISFGLSEGYTQQDVTFFYIARELGNDWREKILENLNDDFLNKIETALSAFREDANIEKAYARNQPLDVPF
jgi:hypothetical protein